MDKNNIGVKFKRLREQTTYTIEEVASICEISFYELKDIEQGVKHPSEKVLKVLLDLYMITDKDLLHKEFVNHNKRKSIINYIQLAIAVLLIFAYALPFSFTHYGNEGATRPLASGFRMLFNNQFGYPNVISILFIMLVLQMILHVLLYTKFKRYSNMFKVIFIMINISGSILLYLDYAMNGNSSIGTLSVFFVLLYLHVGITIYDLIKYPLEHDFLQDKGKMRRWFIFFMNSAYAIAYFWILRDTIIYSYDLDIGILLALIVWGLYLVVYLFIKKSMLESRRNASIILAVPPVTYFIFYTVDMYGTSDFLEPASVLTLGFMFLPLLIINIDYFVDMIRDAITKGDVKEL